MKQKSYTQRYEKSNNKKLESKRAISEEIIKDKLAHGIRKLFEKFEEWVIYP
jgi:hypothetical protein